MLHYPTIVALSTAPSSAALHVIRLSGPESFSLLSHFFASKHSIAKKNSLQYGKWMDGEEEIDEVVVTCFTAPHSFTKENVVEIACHGSPIISTRIISCLTKKGAVPALPGEFTQRAYLNGRFDLAQAEAVADLIHAESEQARKLALSQLKGGVSKNIDSLRQQLLEFLSLLELELDFGEEDVAFANRNELLERIDTTALLIAKLLSSFRSGNAIKEGIPLVIAGRPNAGKSTLLNALLQEDRAIVSAIPGTTRDTIEERFFFNGLAFRLIDTAGIRDAADSDIERLGIERSRDKIKQAEIILCLVDVAHRDNIEEEKKWVEGMEEKVLWVLNKCENAPVLNKTEQNWIPISAANQQIEHLLAALKTMSDARFLQHDVIITNERHYQALQHAATAIDRAKTALLSHYSGEIVVFELKEAIESLGTITGKINNDEVLGAIFSKFCIGK